MPKRQKNVNKKEKVREAKFYREHSWVVMGSVREATKTDIKKLGAHCHGKVCDIRCVDTGALRTINLQDAWQTKRSKEAQEDFNRKQRAERMRVRRAALRRRAS